MPGLSSLTQTRPRGAGAMPSPQSPIATRPAAVRSRGGDDRRRRPRRLLAPGRRAGRRGSSIGGGTPSGSGRRRSAAAPEARAATGGSGAGTAGAERQGIGHRCVQLSFRQKLPQAMPRAATRRPRSHRRGIAAHEGETRGARPWQRWHDGCVADAIQTSSRRQAARPQRRCEPRPRRHELPRPAHDPETAAHRHAAPAARGAPAAALLARLRPGSPRRDGPQSLPRGRGLGATTPAASTSPRVDGEGEPRGIDLEAIGADSDAPTSATTGSSRRRACASRARESDIGALDMIAADVGLRQHLHGQINVLPLDAARPRARLRDRRVARRRRLPAHRRSTSSPTTSGMSPAVEADEMQIALKRVQSLDPPASARAASPSACCCSCRRSRTPRSASSRARSSPTISTAWPSTTSTAWRAC